MSCGGLSISWMTPGLLLRRALFLPIYGGRRTTPYHRDPYLQLCTLFAGCDFVDHATRPGRFRDSDCGQCIGRRHRASRTSIEEPAHSIHSESLEFGSL